MKILNGNCFEIIKKIKDESIDLILTDIPYNISQKNGLGGYDKKNKRNRTGIDFGKWDKGFNTQQLKALPRLVKSGGSVLIFCAFEQIGEIIQAFDGLILKDKIIWKKTNPFVRNRERRYISDIEICLWFVKPKNKWIFNRIHKTYESCVMNYPSESGGGFKRYHPTQKNLKLVEYLIKIHSNENNIILDPFMGGGTTAIACMNTNRKFIGIELDKNYFQKAKDRIQNNKK